jgi:hypothetical protein
VLEAIVPLGIVESGLEHGVAGGVQSHGQLPGPRQAWELHPQPGIDGYGPIGAAAIASYGTSTSDDRRRGRRTRRVTDETPVRSEPMTRRAMRGWLDHPGALQGKV